MNCDIEPASPEGILYRLGRKPDPWALPPWEFAGTDGTFGNRYDDPHGEYRVLYASSQRLAAFVETLARYRADPAVVGANIEGDPRDEQYPTIEAGIVPPGWLEDRSLGTARVSGAFADVGHSRSLAYLRTAMATRIVRHGLQDLDAATIRLEAPRRFTQELSRLVFECGPNGPEFCGVRYRSRLGDDLVNWAIFESAELKDEDQEALHPDDPDFAAALALHNLRLP